MPLYMGLDVGTQSCKALIWDLGKRKVVSSGQKGYEVISSRPGQAEQDPATWIQAVEEAAGAALQSIDRTEVKGIAVSGQQHGLVPLDSSGSVIRPAKLWCDVESAPQATRLSEQLGWKLVPGFTASKLLWLQEEEPENYARLQTVLLPHDYINYWLTGNYAMECGDASGTGLFDTQNRTHNTQNISQYVPDLTDAFPDLVSPNAAIGTLTPATADRLGLSTDTTVAPGSGDNMMSALGVGAVDDGQLVVSLGTSGTLFCPSAAPVFDPAGRIAPFCDATGKWLPLICTMNCTAPPEEIRQVYNMSVDSITALASEAPPGCDGIYMLPYFTGERTPDWPHSRGVILGLTPGALQQPGLLYRAALEASTLSLASGIDLLEEFGVAVSSVRVVGGGSKNPLWLQIMADALGRPLQLPRTVEAAALDAALQAAAVHQGAAVADFVREHHPGVQEAQIEPTAALQDVYAAAKVRHVAAGEALFGSRGSP